MTEDKKVYTPPPQAHVVAGRNDHDRLCQGREYTCTCGYDDERDAEVARLTGDRDRLLGALKLAAPYVYRATSTEDKTMADILVPEAIRSALSAQEAEG